jgi:hypothetical protein
MARSFYVVLVLVWVVSRCGLLAVSNEQWFARLWRDGFKWRQRLSCSLSIVGVYIRVDMLIELGGR